MTMTVKNANGSPLYAITDHLPEGLDLHPGWDGMYLWTMCEECGDTPADIAERGSTECCGSYLCTCAAGIFNGMPGTFEGPITMCREDCLPRVRA